VQSKEVLKTTKRDAEYSTPKIVDLWVVRCTDWFDVFFD